MSELTKVPVISSLSDTGHVIVNDGEDVKQISKTDLMGQIANAKSISYDGSGSGIAADNVQGAITEVKGKVDNLASAYRPKGTVATYADLPTTAEVGWVYNVTNDETTGEKNKNYVWTDTGWDDIGGTYDMSVYYKKTEVDTAITSAVNTEKSARETAVLTETTRATSAEQAEVTARDAAIADKSLKKGTVTIKVADVTATPSDDEFATKTAYWNAHPYCYNLTVDGLTENYECHINYSSNSAIADGTWMTSAGVLRIYLRSMPTADITVQYTLQKAV